MNYKIIVLLISITLASCSLKPVIKRKNITYDATHNLQLDVFTPRKIKEPKKILIFVHGGNWVHGKKSLYKFYGKGMARKGIIGVVVNYRLSPITNYEGMADDVAKATKWVKDNCASFGGDTNNIYISGHSAGAQIAALIANTNYYFDKLHINNPIKGTILIDAFGLNMYRYLKESKNEKDTLYKRVFSNNEVIWKKASPQFYLNKSNPPTLMFLGGKTYPVIKLMTNDYYAELKKYQPNSQLIIVDGKKHVPMIFQFYNPYIKAYKHILNFMDVK